MRKKSENSGGPGGPMEDNDLSCFGFRAGTIFTVCRARSNQFQFQLIAQSVFLSTVCAVNIPSLEEKL